jgi:phosphatidylserine/phosphatidylglycerophosphate/cardiolipin synthase-like enzyme
VTLESFFAPTPAAPNPIEAAWLREINAAESGSVIRIAMYSLTLPSFKDALLDAFDRGVDIRVVADKFAVCNRGRLSDLALALYNDGAGIPMKLYRNASFPNDLMHNKFLVIDDRILATGSANFTIQGTRFNHENMVLIKVVDGKAVFIEDYIRQFEGMWDNDFRFSGHEFVDWQPDPMDCRSVGEPADETD